MATEEAHLAEVVQIYDMSDEVGAVLVILAIGEASYEDIVIKRLTQASNTILT